MSLCTNDPDNGNDTGRVCRVEVGDDEDISLDWTGYRAPKYAITTNRGGLALYISRRKFSIKSMTDWYGNWCWTGVTMTRSEAARLLNYLRKDERWHCDGGTCDICDAYEAGNVTPELLAQ